MPLLFYVRLLEGSTYILMVEMVEQFDLSENAFGVLQVFERLADFFDRNLFSSEIIFRSTGGDKYDHHV